MSAPGYITRDTRSGVSTVDLIPEAGFDLAFYRQLARNGFESPGSLEPLRVLSQAPSIYLQTAGLTAGNVAALEQAARAVVPALTGGRFTVTTWETGRDRRAAQSGWIVVELYTDANAECGRSVIGGGEIRLNTIPICRMVRSFAHELGHALGFWHVADATMLMHAPSGADQPSAHERHHAAIAYKRQAGNRDIDSDQ